MIETICSNCGNRKSFDEAHEGKTFKCPSCEEPVKIESIGTLIDVEPASKTNNYAQALENAELLKKFNTELTQVNERLKRKKDELPGAKTTAITFGVVGLIIIIFYYKSIIGSVIALFCFVLASRFYKDFKKLSVSEDYKRDIAKIEVERDELIRQIEALKD
jgi:hypothetical protein